jgi:hypothetical protein
MRTSVLVAWFCSEKSVPYGNEARGEENPCRAGWCTPSDTCIANRSLAPHIP